MAVMLFHVFLLRRVFSLVPGLALLLFVSVEPVLGRPEPGIYLPGQLLVKFKQAPPGRAQPTPAHLAGIRIKARMPKLGWQLLELPPGMSVPDAMEEWPLPQSWAQLIW